MHTYTLCTCMRILYISFYILILLPRCIVCYAVLAIIKPCVRPSTLLLIFRPTLQRRLCATAGLLDQFNLELP